MSKSNDGFLVPMNTRHITLLTVVILSGAVLLLHIAAYEYYFYWTHWWYDIFMRGLGGLAIGVFVLWVWRYWLSGSTEPLVLFTVSILGTLVIGIVWELFEFAVGSQFHQSIDSYVLDTTFDICMDIVGALVAFMGFKRIP